MRDYSIPLLLVLVGCSSPDPTPTPVEVLDSQSAMTKPRKPVVTDSLDSGCGPTAEPSDSGVDAAIPDSATDTGIPDVITGASAPPRAFVYGESHVARGTFGQTLQTNLGAKWVTSWIGHSGYLTAETYQTAIDELPPLTAEKDRTRRVFILYSGTNDVLRMATNAPADTCKTWEHTTRTRVTEGWSVILLTVTPNRYTVGDAGVGNDTARRGLNTCIVNGGPAWGASAVVDIGNDPQLQDIYGTMFDADHLHLSVAGYQYAAGLVLPAVEALYLAP